MLIVIHNKEPKRESIWNWKRMDGKVKWSIVSYLDGYYQPQFSRDGEMEPEDFEANLSALRGLSPEVFTIKEVN